MIDFESSHGQGTIFTVLFENASFKNPSKIHRKDKSAFMTVDDVGMLYSVQSDKYNYEASVNFMSPLRATKLNDFFNEAWEHGIPDQQVRRLFV